MSVFNFITKRSIHAKILLPAVLMIVAIGVITILVSTRIITQSIDARMMENIDNNERFISQILNEQEDKVAFYSQFMSDMVKLSRQISGTPIGRSMIIYLLDFLEREGIETHLYRKTQKFNDSRQLLIQKGFLGIRATALLELNQKGKPHLSLAGVSPVERKEGTYEAIMAVFKIDDDFLNSIKRKVGADIHIFYGNGSVLSTFRDKECIAKMQNLLTAQLRSKLMSGAYKYTTNLRCQGDSHKIRFTTHPVNLKTQSIYAVSVSMGDLLSARKQLTIRVILIMVLMLSVVVAIYSLNIRRILQPIKELSTAAKKVAQGDLTQSLNIYRGDELGDLCANFNQMVQQLHTARRAMEVHHEKQMERAERLAVMGQMASGVAHEFNNILAIVLANAQLMLKKVRSDSSALRRITAIEQAAKDGAQTVRRIQEFARVRKDESFGTVDINMVITDVVEATKPRWREQTQREGHPVEMEVALGETMLVSGNPAELREVFTNLIFNALDAMPQGGKITIEMSRDKGHAVITVADEGVGMSEEVQQKIFDPFFTTKGYSSSGLGMSVSYGIISRHGGEVQVESEEGKGTIFTIRLPLKEAKDKKSDSETVSEIFKSASVLIIDDEKGILDALSDTLMAMGHRVTTALSGSEGVEKFREMRHDVVFTDLGMPDMNGWEVAKAVKEMSPDTPVTMITGWHVDLNEEKMKAEGVDLVVNKPFEMDKLHKVMAEALHLKTRI